MRRLLLCCGLALGACGGDKGADSASEGAAGAEGGAGDGGDGGSGSTDADGDGVAAADDCDDSDPAVFPGATERCNGVDDDCDGSIPEEEQNADADGIFACTACDEAGFWSLTLAHAGDDAALWEALESAVATVECSYSRSKSQIYTSIDLEGSEVECVYTGTMVAIRGGSPDEGEMNIEHTWPRSEGAEAEPGLCDVHHLFPTTTDSNAERGSAPFGTVTGSTYWSQGGSKLGAGSGGTVFEPRDQHKGNVARAMLYVKLRYGHSPASSEQAVFGAWNASDPVDADEQARSAAIARYQGSENPFVACPTLAARYLD